MRLSVNEIRGRKLRLIAAIGGASVLSACGAGGDFADLESAPPAEIAQDSSGPSADYPIVVGDPYRVGDTLYTPVDTLNYDEVGYLTVNRNARGYTAAHHTLPVPSYIEVTDLATGRTIVARVEERGPMTNNALVALSPAALAQLGAAEGAAIRVRRVTPLEENRVMLRSGQAAPLRMDTPESLLVVLRRKLPASGSASLQPDYDTSPAAYAGGSGSSGAPIARAEIPPSSAGPSGTAGGARPLPPIDGSTTPVSTPAPVPSRPAPVASRPPQNGGFVVQAAAFSDQARANRAANALGARVTRSGAYFRVRTGPFATRAEAEASLAKVRAAGYADARIFAND